MNKNESQDIEVLVKQLQKECRILLDKPDEEFTDQDARKLNALNDHLLKLEQKLPEDYFTPEHSWKRFITRPDIQNSK